MEPKCIYLKKIDLDDEYKLIIKLKSGTVL